MIKRLSGLSSSLSTSLLNSNIGYGLHSLRKILPTTGLIKLLLYHVNYPTTPIGVPFTSSVISTSAVLQSSFPHLYAICVRIKSAHFLTLLCKHAMLAPRYPQDQAKGSLIQSLHFEMSPSSFLYSFSDPVPACF